MIHHLEKPLDLYKLEDAEEAMVQAEKQITLLPATTASIEPETTAIIEIPMDIYDFSQPSTSTAAQSNESATMVSIDDVIEIPIDMSDYLQPSLVETKKRKRTESSRDKIKKQYSYGFKCKYAHCAKTFTKTDQLRDHVLLVHDKKCWQCTECRIKFNYSKAYRVHKKKEGNENHNIEIVNC